MTQVVTKENGKWLVKALQNNNLREETVAK
jgi:hypothetical protein